MSLQWPGPLPIPWSAPCKLADFTNDLTPPMGGQMQRIGRLGARWSVTFAAMPALGASGARAVVALRAKSRANATTIRFPWPQPAFTAAIGLPVVNGASQTGTGLIVNGLTAGAAIPAGTFFSVTVGARAYLYCVTALATADGGGNATLSIAPMLRASPAAAATLTFAQPQIEGFIAGKSEDWTLDRLAWVGLPAFTVTEAA